MGLDHPITCKCERCVIAYLPKSKGRCRRCQGNGYEVPPVTMLRMIVKPGNRTHTIDWPMCDPCAVHWEKLHAEGVTTVVSVDRNPL